MHYSFRIYSMVEFTAIEFPLSGFISYGLIKYFYV